MKHHPFFWSQKSVNPRKKKHMVSGVLGKTCYDLEAKMPPGRTRATQQHSLPLMRLGSNGYNCGYKWGYIVIICNQQSDLIIYTINHGGRMMCIYIQTYILQCWISMNIIPSVGDDFMLIYREYTHNIICYDIIQYNIIQHDRIWYNII